MYASSIETTGKTATLPPVLLVGEVSSDETSIDWLIKHLPELKALGYQKFLASGHPEGSTKDDILEKCKSSITQGQMLIDTIKTCPDCTSIKNFSDIREIVEFIIKAELTDGSQDAIFLMAQKVTAQTRNIAFLSLCQLLTHPDYNFDITGCDLPNAEIQAMQTDVLLRTSWNRDSISTHRDLAETESIIKRGNILSNSVFSHYRAQSPIFVLMGVANMGPTMQIFNANHLGEQLIPIHPFRDAVLTSGTLEQKLFEHFYGYGSSIPVSWNVCTAISAHERAIFERLRHQSISKESRAQSIADTAMAVESLLALPDRLPTSEFDTSNSTPAAAAPLPAPAPAPLPDPLPTPALLPDPALPLTPVIAAPVLFSQPSLTPPVTVPVVHIFRQSQRSKGATPARKPYSRLS